MGSRVNLRVTHGAIAETLRPLSGTRTSLHTQAQQNNGGPKKNIRKVFRDVTNKLEPRPTIAKTPRPTTSSKAAQQAAAIQIFKRPGEVWRSEEVNG